MAHPDRIVLSQWRGISLDFSWEKRILINALLSAVWLPDYSYKSANKNPITFQSDSTVIALRVEVRN